MKNNQKGFSAIEVLFLLVIIGVIGVTGWYVYNRQKHSQSKQPNQTQQITNEDNYYDGWNTYESKTGGFSFKYPNNWTISGFKGTDIVSTNDLTGNEDVIRIDNGAPDNNFGLDFRLHNSAPMPTPFDTYPNGETKQLENSLILWQEKQDINFATGPEKSTCPSVRIGSDSSFATRLASGKFLEITGSYCWGQGMKTSLTYSQQKSSEAWLKAVKIIESVQQ